MSDKTDLVLAASGSGGNAGLFFTGGAIAVLLALSAFFSGSETALTAVSRARMKRKADQEGSKAAARVIKLTEDSERLIGGILLGNNLVNILATSLATSLFLSLFGESGVALATLLMTFLVLVFAEVAPKTYAISNANRAALAVAKPVSMLVSIFSPVVLVVRFMARAALRLFGVRTQRDARMLSFEAHEEIKGAIDIHHSEGGVIKNDRDMLFGALDLKNREVEEVMIHRRNIFMLNADVPPAQIVDKVLKAPYTRVPLWRGEQENIVGLLHAKDLLRAVDALVKRGGDPAKLEGLDVTEIAMEPYFTPETTSLADQLQEFLARRSHVAMVVDEYGVLQGLITLEDIIEEIVGEIADEHDEETLGVVRNADGTYTVEGTTTIRDLNRYFDWVLPDDEASTIAGLVIHEAQMIPETGQKFSFHGFRFEILERVRHQVTKLLIKPIN